MRSSAKHGPALPKGGARTRTQSENHLSPFDPAEEKDWVRSWQRIHEAWREYLETGDPGRFLIALKEALRARLRVPEWVRTPYFASVDRLQELYEHPPNKSTVAFARAFGFIRENQPSWFRARWQVQPPQPENQGGICEPESPRGA